MNSANFSDAPVSELSLELLLLQVVLPALLEQGHTRQWLKRLVAAWTVGVAWLLDLRSYLIGDITLKEGVRRTSSFLVYNNNKKSIYAAQYLVRRDCSKERALFLM